MSPQHENRRRIFPALSRLIPFLTGAVLSALGVGALSGLGEHGRIKTNWKLVASQEWNWCVSDRN